MDSPFEWKDIPYLLRRMRLEDLEEVLEIERACFPLPWPASAFEYDLLRNPHAYYYVVTPRESEATICGGRLSWWRRPWKRQPIKLAILGYSGLWALIDEGHVANIAVAPAWRGRGIGELLLSAALAKAIELELSIATLEVRVSNLIAQSLYRKYGFEVVGRRRRYYSDNGEDAYIMSTASLHSEAYQQVLARLWEQLHFRLRSSDNPSPRGFVSA